MASAPAKYCISGGFGISGSANSVSSNPVPNLNDSSNPEIRENVFFDTADRKLRCVCLYLLCRYHDPNSLLNSGLPCSPSPRYILSRTFFTYNNLSTNSDSARSLLFASPSVVQNTENK